MSNFSIDPLECILFIPTISITCCKPYNCFNNFLLSLHQKMNFMTIFMSLHNEIYNLMFVAFWHKRLQKWHKQWVQFSYNYIFVIIKITFKNNVYTCFSNLLPRHVVDGVSIDGKLCEGWIHNLSQIAYSLDHVHLCMIHDLVSNLEILKSLFF
jgi:hypothetical protein